VSALVRADTTEASGGLEVGKVFLDGLAGNAKGLGHALLRQMGLSRNQLENSVDGFLTTFSDNLFLTTFFRPLFRGRLALPGRFEPVGSLRREPYQQIAALQLVALAEKQVAEERKNSVWVFG
jgi:hypothetical protein